MPDWTLPELIDEITAYGLARDASNEKTNGATYPGSAMHLEPFRNMLDGQVQAEEFTAADGKARGQSNVWFKLQNLFSGHPWQVEMVEGSYARISNSLNPQDPAPLPRSDMLMYLAVILLHEEIAILMLANVEAKAASVPEV